MAVLDSTARSQIKAHVMRRWGCALTKSDLQAAIDATDNWIDSNAASFNSALPSVAQSTLSAAEKTILFCVVALKRAGFGEVI